MATYFFGINVGLGKDTVTKAATTTGKDLEVVLNTTANVPSVNDVLLAIEKLQGAITEAGKAW